MDKTIEHLEAAALPSLAEVYRGIVDRKIDALAWKISSDNHRIKFLIEMLMEKRFHIFPDPKMGTYLNPQPNETLIRFGGIRKINGHEEMVLATDFISLLATEIGYLPDHIRKKLNEICRLMLPFSEPLEVL